MTTYIWVNKHELQKKKNKFKKKEGKYVDASRNLFTKRSYVSCSLIGTDEYFITKTLSVLTNSTSQIIPPEFETFGVVLNLSSELITLYSNEK
jgi:hypothetical protein